MARIIIDALTIGIALLIAYILLSIGIQINS